MSEYGQDRIPPSETQPERERRVFRFFAVDAAQYAGLPLIAETMTSRDPPEPDILCEIEGHGSVAFELAEILDQASMKIMATMMRARDKLLAFPSMLSAADQLAFQSKFQKKYVKVAFRQDKPQRELEAAIPGLYEWLIQTVPHDVYGYSVPIPRSLQEAIEYVSILFPGPPLIDIAFGVSVADATVPAITRKVELKKYSTTAPIDLLVFAHDQPLIEYERWQETVARSVVPLIDSSIARGHIRRVWVYSVGERRTNRAIKFVYPPWRSD